MKSIKSYSINPEVAEQFKNQTPKGKTSQELQRLMEEYIDGDIEKTGQTFDIVQDKNLTDRQKELFSFIIEEDLFGASKSSIKHEIQQKEGIYGRGHQFKEGIKAVLNKSSLENDKGYIVAGSFDCPCCDSESTLKEVVDYNGRCFECSEKLI